MYITEFVISVTVSFVGLVVGVCQIISKEYTSNEVTVEQCFLDRYIMYKVNINANCSLLLEEGW